MSEGNGHEGFEPTREQIELALKQVRRANENKLEAVKGLGPRELRDKDADALVQVLANIPVFSEIPPGDEEFGEWERKNPEKAKQLRNSVTSVLQEFEP